MDAKKILKAELIGLKVRVIDSRNKSNIGISGKILDETKNTLRIGDKTILKRDAIIEFEVDDQKITVEGKKLLKNPEERIKIR